MKLRQVVLAAERLEPSRTLLFDLLGVKADFADPGVAAFGLENSVMAVGDQFLEIVAPQRSDTAAGRLLARRGAPCGYMLIFQVEDFAATERRLEGLGVRRVWHISSKAVSACHVHPKDVGGAIVSFDQMRPPEDWVWGGPRWRDQRAAEASRVLGCTLQSPDAPGLTARWAEVLDRRAHGTEGGQRIALDDGTWLDFVPSGGFEGIRSFHLATRDPAALRARARRLGLDPERPRIGDLELRFDAED